MTAKMDDAIGNASVAITLSNGESSLENLEASVKLLDGGDGGDPRGGVANNGGTEEEVSTAPTSSSTIGVNSTTKDADNQNHNNNNNNNKEDTGGESSRQDDDGGYGVDGEASLNVGGATTSRSKIDNNHKSRSSIAYNERGYGDEGEVSLRFGDSISTDIGTNKTAGNGGDDGYGVEGEVSLSASASSFASTSSNRRKRRSRSRDKSKSSSSSALKAPSTPSKSHSTPAKAPSTPSAPSTPTSSSKSPHSRNHTPRSKERRRRREASSKTPRTSTSTDSASSSKPPTPSKVSSAGAYTATTSPQHRGISSTPDSSISRDSTGGSASGSISSFASASPGNSEPNSPATAINQVSDPPTSPPHAPNLSKDHETTAQEEEARDIMGSSHMQPGQQQHQHSKQMTQQQEPDSAAPNSLAANLYMIGRRDEDDSERYDDDGTMVDTMVDTAIDDVSVASSSMASFYSAALPDDDEEDGHRSTNTSLSPAGDRQRSDRSSQQPSSQRSHQPTSSRSTMSNPETPRRQSSRSKHIGDEEGERTPSGRSRRSSRRGGTDKSRHGEEDENILGGSNHGRSRSRRSSRKGGERDEDDKRKHRSRSRHSGRSHSADPHDDRSRSKSRHRSKSEKRRHGRKRTEKEERSRSTSRGALERKAKARGTTSGGDEGEGKTISTEGGGTDEGDEQVLQTPRKSSRRTVERKSSKEDENMTSETGKISPAAKTVRPSSDSALEELHGSFALNEGSAGELPLVTTPKKTNRVYERKSSTDSDEITPGSQRGSKSRSNSRGLVERYSSDSDGGLKGATSKSKEAGEGSTSRRTSSSKSPTRNRRHRRARQQNVKSSLEQMLAGGSAGGGGEEDFDRSIGSILTYDTAGTSETTSSRRHRSPHSSRHRRRRRSKDKDRTDDKSIVSTQTTATQETTKAGSSPRRRSRRYSSDDALPVSPSMDGDDHNQSIASIQRASSLDSAAGKQSHNGSNSLNIPPIEGTNSIDALNQPVLPLKRLASLDSATNAHRRHTSRSNSSGDDGDEGEKRSSSLESNSGRRKHKRRHSNGDTPAAVEEDQGKPSTLRRTKSDESSNSQQRPRSNSADGVDSAGGSPKRESVQRNKSDGSSSGQRKPGSKNKDIVSPDVEDTITNSESKDPTPTPGASSPEPSFRLSNDDDTPTNDPHAGESSTSLHASKLQESSVGRRRGRHGSKNQIGDDGKHESVSSVVSPKERARVRRSRRHSKDDAPPREEETPSSAEKASPGDESEAPASAPTSARSSNDDAPGSKPSSAATVESIERSASLRDMRRMFRRDFPGAELPPDDVIRTRYKGALSPRKTPTRLKKVKDVPVPIDSEDGAPPAPPRRLTQEDRDAVNEASLSSINEADLMRHLEAVHGAIGGDKNSNSASGGEMSTRSELSTQSEMREENASSSYKRGKRKSLQVIKKMWNKPKNALFKKGSHGEDKSSREEDDDDHAAASSHGTDIPDTDDTESKTSKTSDKDLKDKAKDDLAKELERRERELERREKELERKEKEAKEFEKKKEKEAKELEKKKEKEAKELLKKKEKEAKELEKKKEKEAKELEKKKEKEAKDLENKKKKEAKELENKKKKDAKLAKELEKKEKEKAKKEKKEQEKREKKEKKEKAKLEKKEKSKKDKSDRDEQSETENHGDETERTDADLDEKQESAPPPKRTLVTEPETSSRDLLMKSIRELDEAKGKKKGLKAVKIHMKKPGVLKRSSISSGVKRLSGLLKMTKADTAESEGWGGLDDTAASARFLGSLPEDKPESGESRPKFADASDDEMDFGGNESFVVSNEAMQFCFDGKAAITHVSSEESTGELMGHQQDAADVPEQHYDEESDDDEDDNDEYDDASSDDDDDSSYDDDDDYQDSYVPTLLSNEQLATVVEVDNEVDVSTHSRRATDKKKERSRRKSKHAGPKKMPTGRPRMAPSKEGSDTKKEEPDSKNRRARRQRNGPSNEKVDPVAATSSSGSGRLSRGKASRDKSDRHAEDDTDVVPPSPRKRSSRTSRSNSGGHSGRGGEKPSSGIGSNSRADPPSSPRRQRKKAQLQNFLEQADQEIEDEYGELDLEDVDPDENVAFEDVATPVRIRRKLTKPGPPVSSPGDRSHKSEKSSDMPVAFRSDSSKPALPSIFSGARIDW